MQKRILLAASTLLFYSVTQPSPAFDTKKITIQINDQLPGGTVYAQPYSGFYVDQLRKSGIETLEITVVNNSAEPITITPSCITNIEPMPEKTAENGLLDFPRFVNLVAGSIFVLLILSCWLAKYMYYPLEGKKLTLTSILLGVSFVGLPGAWLSGKIEDYIWTKIAENALFEPITVQPGHTVKKFIFVDKNTVLPQTYVCRVVDAQGQEYSIHADKVSAGH